MIEESTAKELLGALNRIADCLDQMANPGKAISNDERACLLLLTLDNPTKSRIAQLLGYKDSSGMKRFPLFNKAWKRFQAMKTIRLGDGRSAIGIDEFD